MAAVPSIGRAVRVEPPAARESDATRDLYERFAGQIFGYCLHQLGSREEAEDAVQTTFMNAFRGFQRGIVPAVESAWLFKIAHNVCLSRRRSTWRRGKVESPNNLEVLQEVVPAREGPADELIRLQDALEGMPEGQRRAILLREWQGLSYREIADELGLSQSAVETLIFRARRTLASGLEVEPEQRSWRKRARHSFDAGSLLAAAKTLLTGGTTVKVAATVAVATTAAVAVSSGHHRAAPRASQHHVSKTRSIATVHALRSTSARVAPVISHPVAVTRHTASRRHVVHARVAPQRLKRESAPPAAVEHVRPAESPPATQAAPAESENHVAQAPRDQPVKKQDEPAPPPQPSAKTDSGKGHAKQPQEQSDTQSEQQPSAQSGATSQDDNGKHDGNGDGGNGDGGNGHK